MPLPHITHPRLLFYAVNGLGLGHVTRLLAIARAVRALRPGAQILFITTTEADSVIYREGFASVKIPSRNIIQASELRPSTYNKLAQSVVMNTVAAFNPAILIVDTFPAGATQELLPTLSWEMKRVFVYRAQQSERARDVFFQGALARYDLGIVPHAQGMEDIPAPDSLPFTCTGPILIRERSEMLPRSEARALLGLQDDGDLLYVTVGGGGDDEMAGAEGLIFDAARRTGWKIVAPVAPLLSSSGARALGRPDFRVSHYPMAEVLSAFDAAVSAGGYNSFHELLHFGLPTLFIPRPRGLDDQFTRCRRAEAAGAALVASLDGVEIANALEKLTDPALRENLSAKARGMVEINGTEIAAKTILGLLG